MTKHATLRDVDTKSPVPDVCTPAEIEAAIVGSRPGTFDARGF